MSALTSEYIERERQLERVVEHMGDKELMYFALWELYGQIEGGSDAVACELLKRSGVTDSLAKY